MLFLVCTLRLMQTMNLGVHKQLSGIMKLLRLSPLPLMCSVLTQSAKSEPNVRKDTANSSPLVVASINTKHPSPLSLLIPLTHLYPPPPLTPPHPLMFYPLHQREEEYNKHNQTCSTHFFCISHTHHHFL